MAVGFLLVPDARSQLGPYLALFAAGSVLSLLAAKSLSASGPGFVLLSAAVLRATLLFRAPDLSDDIFRYLWDGRVARAGISPYALAPDDPALADISPALRRRVAHRDIRGVYPPVAQAVFRWFGGEANSMPLKAFFAAADLGVVALLARSGAPGGGFAAALYAFHPLPATETAGQGHLDSLGVALLAASVAFLARRRAAPAGIALALSVLTKYISLAALPVFMRRGRWRFAGAFLIAAAAIWFSSVRGVSPAGGLGSYATRWSFNSPVYGAAVWLMEATGAPEKAKAALLDWKRIHHDPPWTLEVFRYFYSAFFARALLGLLLVGVLAAIAARARDLEGGILASIGALLLLSPTIHPWYLLWLLPFAALKREPAFLYLSCAAPLAYALAYPLPLPGISARMILAAEYLPFSVLLLRTLWKRTVTAR